jgi:hypothetical protein
MTDALTHFRRQAGGVARGAVAAVSLFSIIAAPSYVMADDDQSELVYPPRAVIAGRTYSDWTARWWQYIFPIPAEVNPTNDTSGTFCNVAQRGPVWFLAGINSGGPVKRSCTIPAAGKPIFFPIINAECSTQDVPALQYPKGFRCTAVDGKDQDCGTCATLWREQIDPTSLKVTVDGHDVPALSTFRFQSPLFPFHIPKNNILVTGAPGTGFSVTDGYWLMLKPLQPGHHSVQFAGAYYPSPNPGMGFNLNVTYELTVTEPEER